MAKLVNFPISMVKLMLEDGDLKDDKAFASITLNPDIAWAKFILTDDSVNANKDRIPEEEFENLIRTGINMPIKMAFDQIEDGHDESYPIGVITHLKKVKNQIVGLAALWKHERPRDIEYIKSRYDNGEPLDLSWEISYAGEVIQEDGTRNLIGTSLNATTLVGVPAYEGRLGVVALASKEEEVTKLEEKIKELQDKLMDATDINLDLVKMKDELEASLKEAIGNLETATAELEELKQFKGEIVAAQERVEKLASIKAKFAEAGLEKDEEYFEDKAEVLLGMDEASLEFFIQEAIAFVKEASVKRDTEEASEKEELPNFNDGKEFSELSPSELAELARDTEKKTS